MALQQPDISGYSPQIKVFVRGGLLIPDAWRSYSGYDSSVLIIS